MKDEKKEEIIVTKQNKEKSNKKKRHIIIRIFDFTVWIVLFILLSVCAIDYINIKNDKEPKYCIEKGTIKYDDGIVNVCKGIGYTIYEYKRESVNGFEFIPFWEK